MPDVIRSEAESWLRRARDDLGAARKLLSGDDPFPATAAYHCQQAAEKALKAVIAGTGDPIPKTHDLRVLIERCIRIDQSLAELEDVCEELTPYATEFRYPSEIPDPDLGEVQSALELAERVTTAIETHIQRQIPH
jgi:HEPN domain-containing protein